MKHEPSGSYSELSIARQIASRLKGGPPGTVAATARATVEPRNDDFVRFDATRLLGDPETEIRPPVASESDSSPLEPPEHVVAASQSTDAASLNTILGWCREVTGADTVFVLNDQGLIVAAQGPLSAESVALVGSRLMIGIDQAGLMGDLRGALQTILFEFESGYLTGLRVEIDAEKAVTVGVLADQPVPPETGRRVSSLLFDRLRH